MHTKTILRLMFSILFLQLSCSTENKPTNKAETKVDAAYKSVMAVHDEVMPEMGTIHRLRKKINEKMRAANADEESKASYRKMVKMLDDADEGMMSWMADFKMPKEGSEEEKLSYLKGEQQKINKVSDDMYAAIKEAELILSK